MKKIFFLFLIIPIIGNTQPMGKIMDGLVMQSTTLKHPVNYAVYLPPDYDVSNRSYPVVYLLHGYTDDHTGWVQYGEINRYADKGIAEGKIPPMIIVMPDADSTFYINTADGKANYETFFIKEFIPKIEKAYRIRGTKRYRGIAGLSMGGYGSLIYALKYPDMFAAAAPLSAAVLDDEEIVNMDDNWYSQTFAPLYGPGKGKERLDSGWYRNSILKIINDKPASELKKVRYWIDCGDDDFLINGNCLLKIALTKKQVPHEFRVREGVHNWTYWRTGITDALHFIGRSFNQD